MSRQKGHKQKERNGGCLGYLWTRFLILTVDFRVAIERENIRLTAWVGLRGSHGMHRVATTGDILQGDVAGACSAVQKRARQASVRIKTNRFLENYGQESENLGSI